MKNLPKTKICDSAAHLMRKIREVGLKNTLIGLGKRSYYKQLQKQFHFDEWHISPYELRAYIQAVALQINLLPVTDDDEIIDIGCGLGELLRHVRHCNKTGMDYSVEALAVARLLDKKRTITWQHGSFDELGSGRHIACLITLGFMHGGTTEGWLSPYRRITAENAIDRVIVDVFPSEKGDCHFIDFSFILSDYYLEHRLGPFLSDRYIEIYKKR